MGNYKKWLVDFFVFYRDFDFAQFVISTHFGGAMLRDQYHENINLARAMCIVGPIQQDVNCAYYIGKKRLRVFQHICDAAVGRLTRNAQFF